MNDWAVIAIAALMYALGYSVAFAVENARSLRILRALTSIYQDEEQA